METFRHIAWFFEFTDGIFIYMAIIELEQGDRLGSGAKLIPHMLRMAEETLRLNS